MANRQIIQFVDYKIDDLNEKLKGIDDKIILKFGIQGPPGLEIYMGEAGEGDPCFKIGHTGIFTFDFSDLTDTDSIGIQKIRIGDNESNKNLVEITGQEIIIDIIYQIKGGNAQ